MYTVLWTDRSGKGRWARCGCRNDVAALLTKEHIRDDPHVMVFAPEADECTIDVEDIFRDI